MNESATYHGFDAGFLRIAMLDSESMIKGDDRQTSGPAPSSPRRRIGSRSSCCTGRCGARPERLLRHHPEKLLPIIRETGVRLMFTAHDHILPNVREGLTQVITAGGGAPR